MFTLVAIDAPDGPEGMDASFWEFGSPEGPGGECPFPFSSCTDRIVELPVLAHSSITLTVFVQPYSNPYETFWVNVEEINLTSGNSTGFRSSVALNPDPVNTRMIPVQEEYHTITMVSEEPVLLLLSDATMLSGPIVYSPYLEELLNYSNPDIVTPGLRHPGLRHDTIINPGLRHTSMEDSIPDGEVTDLQWRVTNNTNMTSAYSFEPIGEIPDPVEGIEYQLLIYRVNTTPASENCVLSEEEHHELLLTIENPGLRHPGLRHPGLRHPGLRHNTFFLAPGETAICTLRVIAPTSNPFDPEDYATTVAGAAIPQGANPEGIIDFASSLYIIARDLATGSVNDLYTETLEAYGGTPASIEDPSTPEDPNDDIWKYLQWTEILQNGESMLPPGLTLSSDGIISGDLVHDPDATSYPKDYYFTVEVKDESNPQQIARRNFKITIYCEPHITATATGGGSTNPPGDVIVACGSNQEFTMNPDNDCFLLADVEVDGISVGATNPYTFYGVTKNHTIHAIFTQKTYTITATATEGGSISPAGEVLVNCGEEITFTITPETGNQVMYVLVDGQSVGAVISHEFIGVTGPHTIHAAFGWVRRYNNASVNKDDEPSDIAVSPSGNPHVTGFSWGDTTGPDFFTTSYDSGGNPQMSARYDGPAHKGDFASAVIVGDEGDFYVTGKSYRGMPRKHSDYLTVKFDSSGNVVWDARYDARRNGMDMATAIAFYKDENEKRFVYITGRSQNSESKKGDLHFDYYTIKYDAVRGRVKWAERYNNDGVNGYDGATALAVDSEGNVYVTGFSSNGADNDYVTIKYNSEGQLDTTWGDEDSGVARFHGDFGGDEAVALALDEDQSGHVHVYVTGKSEGDETGFDYVTIKYDRYGQLVDTWGTNGVARYEGSYKDEAVGLALDTFGNVYVTGTSFGNGTGSDYYTIKYDISGEVVWEARYDNSGIDEAVAIAVFEDPLLGYVHVYVTGKSQGNGTGFDFATIKYEQ